MRESVEAGAKGFVVISAGFGEVGGEGVGREEELLELVRANGLHMIGPNCMGVLNTETITDVDADQMIHDVKMIKLLEGFHGEPARDLEALTDALLHVSQLAMRHPEIAERWTSTL